MLSPEDSGSPAEGSEPVQVLTIRGNRVYLPVDVRAAFNLHDGDRIVIYNSDGRMSVRIVRRSRPSRPTGSNH